MTRISTFIAMMTLSLAGSLQAAPSPITSAGALAATDSVNWSQLGSDGTVIPATFGAISLNSLAISGSFAGADGCVAVVGGSNCGWAAGPGFNANDYVIWAEDDSGGPSGPLALSFSPVLGAGLYIQANASGVYTASIEAFNGAVSLGVFQLTSNAGGDGLFIGVKDTTADITGIKLNITSCSATLCNDFGANSLLLAAAPPVPEPATMTLFLLGGLGLGFIRRRSRSSDF